MRLVNAGLDMRAEDVASVSRVRDRGPALEGRLDTRADLERGGIDVQATPAKDGNVAGVGILQQFGGGGVEGGVVRAEKGRSGSLRGRFVCSEGSDGSPKELYGPDGL